MLGTGTPQKQTERHLVNEDSWQFVCQNPSQNYWQKLTGRRGEGHTTEGRVSMKNLWGPTNLTSC